MKVQIMQQEINNKQWIQQQCSISPNGLKSFSFNYKRWRTQQNTGNSGQLRHNNGIELIANQNKDYNTSQLVEFFTKHNLKVKQVALGDYHTVALTQDSDVWTWSQNGKEQNFFMDYYFYNLKHGDSKNRYTSSQSINFTNTIKENNGLYVWGSVFGDGNNKSLIFHKEMSF